MVVRARAHDTETACRLIGRNPDCAPGAGAVTETGIDSASANRTAAKTVTAAKASGIPPSPRKPKAIGGATAIASDEGRRQHGRRAGEGEDVAYARSPGLIGPGAACPPRMATAPYGAR